MWVTTLISHALVEVCTVSVLLVSIEMGDSFFGYGVLVCKPTTHANSTRVLAMVSAIARKETVSSVQQ